MEKQAICEVMCDIGGMFGQTTSVDGKEDLAQFRKELGRRLDMLKASTQFQNPKEKPNNQELELNAAGK